MPNPSPRKRPIRRNLFWGVHLPDPICADLSAGSSIHRVEISPPCKPVIRHCFGLGDGYRGYVPISISGIVHPHQVIQDAVAGSGRHVITLAGTVRMLRQLSIMCNPLVTAYESDVLRLVFPDPLDGPGYNSCYENKRNPRIRINFERDIIEFWLRPDGDELPMELLDGNDPENWFFGFNSASPEDRLQLSTWWMHDPNHWTRHITRLALRDPRGFVDMLSEEGQPTGHDERVLRSLPNLKSVAIIFELVSACDEQEFPEGDASIGGLVHWHDVRHFLKRHRAKKIIFDHDFLFLSMGYLPQNGEPAQFPIQKLRCSCRIATGAQVALRHELRRVLGKAMKIEVLVDPLPWAQTPAVP